LAAITISGTLCFAQVNVVTSSPTIADLVRQVGGEHVSVVSLMRAVQNPHRVGPRPSFMMKMRQADLFFHTGLDAEPWVQLLLKGVRQARLLPGGEDNVNVSAGIELMQVPERGQLSRQLGDIHVYGNPHYLLDPLNGIIVSQTIEKALAKLDREHAAEFHSRRERLVESLRRVDRGIAIAMSPYKGTPVVTFHRTWPYLLRRLGLRKIGEIEPKPGITPFPAHLDEIVRKMTDEDCRIVIIEPFNSARSGESVAERAGGKAVVLATEVGAAAGAESYQNLFHYNVRVLLATLREAGVPSQNAAETGEDRD